MDSRTTAVCKTQVGTNHDSHEKAGMEMVAMVQVSHAFVFGFALLLACVSIRLVSLS